MAGEIPTEASALRQVKVSIEMASGFLNGELGHDDPKLEALFLEQVYVAIHRLYLKRQNPEALADALEQAAEAEESNLRERAELLEDYGFGSDTEAAEHIISYWQGERPDDLLRSVMGFGNTELWRQASHFASEATADDPEARQRFTGASNLLWRGYRGGHG